jgi:ABC-type multidrug transport system fused ATPase/permease subunit
VIKGIKMLGFTNRLTEIIQGLRVRELHLSTRFRRLLWVRVFLANSTTSLAPLVTFIVFVLIAKSTGRTLDTAAAFTGLSLISLLAGPMNTMIRTIPMLNASTACFDRIQKFLNSDARQDHRLPLNPTDSNEAQTPLESFEGIELKQMAPKVSEGPSDNAMIVAQNASFSWISGGEPVVRDASFTLPRHRFCFIIGPVGSGKSTLLKGILGETPSSKGFVYSSFPTTSYVDQTPWIQNGTIQQNILGISTFDEPWYRQVVRACALEQDITMLPKGHGLALSYLSLSLN